MKHINKAREKCRGLSYCGIYVMLKKGLFQGYKNNARYNELWVKMRKGLISCECC